jgi:membrane protease YdiL (CAAX protease family)
MLKPGLYPGLSIDNPRYIGVFKFSQIISSVTIFLVPALLYARLTSRDRPFEFLGFRPAQRPYFYALAVAILVLSFPLEGWLGEINQKVHLPAWMTGAEKEVDKQMIAYLKVNSSIDIIVNVIMIAVLPAICEEACFRGGLQRILIQAFKSPWAGIIVTAIFFSAFHMQFAGFLPRMFLGILLGAIYWYSGSLWASILAHFFTNGIQVVAASYYPRLITENPSVPIYAALISLVIVVGLLSVMGRRSTTSYARVYGPDEMDGFHQFPSI